MSDDNESFQTINTVNPPKRQLFASSLFGGFFYSSAFQKLSSYSIRKNVGDFLKNVGVFSKNVGDFQRYLRRYLYSIQHIPRNASIFRLQRRALLLFQAMVPLQNWACFAFGQRLLRCRTSAFITSPRDLKAQKNRVCQNLTHPLS